MGTILYCQLKLSLQVRGLNLRSEGCRGVDTAVVAVKNSSMAATTNWDRQGHFLLPQVAESRLQ